MAVETEQLKDQLAQTDAAFRQLVLEHHSLDARIRQLSNSLLTAPEQLEEVALKKRKLHLKDQIEYALRRHRTDAPPAQRH
ncbi:MAG: YdcH family protein [Acidobacteriota bacterium]|nr:YdcH family protein [Acidobacteriota bacterium]